MASVTICFSSLRSCSAETRPKTGTSRKRTPRKFSQNPNSKLKTRSKSKEFSLPPPTPLYGSGGEATTYTRLPPKDDFVEPSFELSNRVVREVKLYDSPLPNVAIAASDSVDDDNDDEDGDEVLGFEYDFIEKEESEKRISVSVFDDDEDVDDDELGFEFEGEKEKGVPAVMRCFDRAKIYVKAGDGGNGVVAFRREKFVPFGGPSGGDGGKGGNVYVEVDRSMNSLLPFRKNIHFRAGRGKHGQGREQYGAKGEDVVVKVAPGTVIREAGGDGDVLMELLYPGQRAMLLPGGRGGKGNAAFKSGTNKVPRIAEKGEEGAEM